MAEYIDIYDASMNPAAPFKMERKEVSKHGHWHHVFDCWIMRRDAAGDKILLQLRSATKANNPGLFDISAAGWLQSGETHADGWRELEEELGIRVKPGDLYYLGMMKEALDRPGYSTRAFCHTYFYELQQPLSSLMPQESEVDGVFEISIDDGLRLFSGSAAAIPATGFFKGVPQMRNITLADMCNAHDRCTITNYYAKIFTLAQRFLKGERPLYI